MNNRGPKTKHRPVVLPRAVAHKGTAAQSAVAKQSGQQTRGTRAVHAPVQSESSATQALLQMQRQHGNRIVQQRLGLARKGRGRQAVPASVAQRIQRARGGGQPLDRSVRRQMERALGTDFRGVRVHTDSEADSLNRVLKSRAFTSGRDIFFRQGAYDPDSLVGRELMYHETLHVAQQGNREPGTTRRSMALSQPGDRFEREANQVAGTVARRERRDVRSGAGNGTVQRQPEEEDRNSVQSQPEEEKEDAVQTQAEEEREEAVQARAEEENEEPVQTRAEEEEGVQTQPEEEEESAVQARLEDGTVHRQSMEDEEARTG